MFEATKVCHLIKERLQNGEGRMVRGGRKVETNGICI
jgi:hypothetical protein